MLLVVALLALAEPAAAVAPAAPAAVSASGPLGLVEALALGFEAHPELAAADASVNARDAEIAIAYRPFIPRLFWDVRAFQQAEPVFGANITLAIPRGKVTAEGVAGAVGVEGAAPMGLDYRLAFSDTLVRSDSPLLPFSAQMQPTLTLRLTQNVWRGLLPAVNLAPADAADARARAAFAAARRTRRDLALRIAEAWVAAANDAEVVHLQERSLDYAKKLEKLTKELIDAGKLSTIDMALPLQSVRARETELALARARANLSRAGFAAVLMMPDRRLAERVPSLATVAAWQQATQDADEAVKSALERSPELEQLRAERDDVRAALVRAEDEVRPDIRVVMEGRVSGLAGTTNCPAGYLPDGQTPCYVGQQFVGGYDRALGNAATGEYYGVSVGLTGTIPTFFTPWTAPARARRADLASIDAAVAASERRIDAEVRGVYADARARQDVVALAQQTVQLAEAALEAEDTKLRAGRSTGFDVVRAQENVIAALTQQTAARTQAALSLLRLRAFLVELGPEHAALYPPAPAAP